MVGLISRNDAPGITVTLPDGRTWGPFGGETEAAAWREIFGGRPERLATARQVFEGSVHGEEYHVVDSQAAGLGLHPFREVIDWYHEDDNGLVLADMSRGILALDPEAAVMVSRPVTETPSRRLPGRYPPPPVHDLRNAPIWSRPCPAGGEIVVAQDRGDYFVCWRRDQRRTRDLAVISLHKVEAAAVAKAAVACENYAPPPKPRSKLHRDYQAAKVYRWERGIERSRETFTDIEGCRSYAGRVCAELGVETPAVSDGRANLENHSYFSRLKGVVLQSSMRNTDIILHELAHYVVSLDVGLREPSHGPVFAGTLAGMLSRFADADLGAAIDAAAEDGIVIDVESAFDVAGVSRGYGPSS